MNKAIANKERWKYMKEVKSGTYTRVIENGDETYNFNFYTELSAVNKLKFVNSVIDILIDENHYNSVIRDLIFDFYVIDIMTDVDTSELKSSPTFLNDVEKFLEETNIIDIVMANVRPSLFVELNKAVDDSIEYLTGIHSNPLNEAITSLVNTIEKKINEVDLDSMMVMAQNFAKMTNDLTLDKAMDAYYATDAHKKNMVEIDEVKKRRTEFANDMDKAIKIVGKK